MTSCPPTGYRRLFWSEARLERMIFALVFALAIAAVLTALTDTIGKSMIRCGDFPGFYAPAQILLQGRGSDLYSRALQQEIENYYWPGMQQAVLVSVYPAFFAVFLLPLAYLPAAVAKWVFAVICFAGVALFAKAGVPRDLRPRVPYGCRVAALALFPPTLVSLVGGQNTGLTLGLVAVLVWGLCCEPRGAKMLAGIALAALLYKPQFGLFLFLPIVLWRQWWVLLPALITAALLYLLAVPWVGLGWLWEWLQAVAQFAPENFQVNGRLMISPLSALYLLGVELPGLGGVALSGLGYAVAILWLNRWRPSLTPQLFAVVVALTAVCSPQALFYDLGLMAPLLLCSVLQEGDRAIGRLFLWSALFLVAHAAVATVAAPLLPALALSLVLFEGRRVLGAAATMKAST